VREHSAIVTRNLLFLFVCFLLICSIGCRKNSETGSKVTVELDGLPKTYRVGHEPISLKISDALGQAVSGAQVSLEGNMSHAGMAPTFGQAAEVAPGSYRGTLEFSMAGDWVISVTARLSDGRQVEQQFEIKGVRPN
jgi:hypothetical protein